MLNLINTFKNDETGAVTVDWVVLTAALVGLGLAVITVVSGGVNDLTNDISDELEKNVTTSTLINSNGGGTGGVTTTP